MGTALALASALCYGIADVTGGLLSRRANPVAVALAGQAGGLVLALLLTPVLPGDPQASDLAWGALSGVGTGVGMAYLYRGLAQGAMSVVVPVSAVGGIALPVLAGVVVLGDRPSLLASLGVAAAAPALWLVSHAGARSSAPAETSPQMAAESPLGRPARRPAESPPGGVAGSSPARAAGSSPARAAGSSPARAAGSAPGPPAGGAAGSGRGARVAGARDGLVAGAGIALQYLALAQAGPESGVWAVVAGRVSGLLTVALLTVGPMAMATPDRLRLARLRLARLRLARRPLAHRRLACLRLARGPLAREGQAREGLALAGEGPEPEGLARGALAREGPEPEGLARGALVREGLARMRLARGSLLGALGTGAVAALALVCYLAATRTELLVLAVVLASFYPVIPVVLGVLVLHERPTRGQLLGLATSAAAVTLITLG